MKVYKLKYNPDNPRRISPHQLDKLKKSIESFPEMMELRPIVYDPDTMHVLGGNQRLAAIKSLGMKDIPDSWVLSADKLTPEQKREFVIKDNAQLGEWDFDLLNEGWGDLDLDGWGVEMPDFKSDFTDVGDGDAEPKIDQAEELQTKWKTAKGQVWQCGRHRIMCGDCTNPDAAKRLMNGNTAKLLFTSPPYGDLREYGNDANLSVDNVIRFISAFYPYVDYQVVNLGIITRDREIVPYWDSYISHAKEAGYKFMSWGVWVKQSAGSIGQQASFIPIAHEWLFVFGKEFTHINRAEERKSKVDKRVHRTKRNPDGTTTASSAGVPLALKEMTTVVHCNTELGSIREYHPATFSIDLPISHIRALTDEGDIVVDPFLGSGSTMISCQNTNRVCYGMEINPNYIAVTLQRYLDSTGEMPVLVEGE